MDESSGHKKQIITILAVLIIVAVIVGATLALEGKDDSGGTTNNSGGTSQTTQVEADPNATYTNGTYKAVGDYTSPGGNEEITISVTLEDGVITDTSAESGAKDAEARDHQEDFIAGYKSEVVGKKLSEISLDRVGGSSLTSQGFNDAIQQIRDQAEV